MGTLHWNPPDIVLTTLLNDALYRRSRCCLASGAEDGTLRLWDTRVGDGGGVRELRCFGGADAEIAVTSVAYSADVRPAGLRLSADKGGYICACVPVARPRRTPLWSHAQFTHTGVIYAQAKGSDELYAAAGEEIFCFDLRKLGGADGGGNTRHHLRTPRGLEQADPETRATMLAESGDNVQKMARVRGTTLTHTGVAAAFWTSHARRNGGSLTAFPWTRNAASLTHDLHYGRLSRGRDWYVSPMKRGRRAMVPKQSSRD